MISVISKFVKEMALGMASFQEKGFSKNGAFLENQSELERYCYFVAGTVGLMLTALFSECSTKISPEIRARLERRSVAFGLGLQMTNIAKDFLTDRGRGWCYIPRDFFIEEGIDPISDSLTDCTEKLFKVQKRLISLALGNLDEALQYTLDIPRTLVRYRLFCLWPLFMAVKTLGKLYHEQSFFTDKVVKITRNDVKHIVQSTSLAVLSNHALKLLYYRIRPLIR
jgi:farnesyl-diphosphate farnesyltransferase